MKSLFENICIMIDYWFYVSVGITCGTAILMAILQSILFGTKFRELRAETRYLWTKAGEYQNYQNRNDLDVQEWKAKYEQLERKLIELKHKKNESNDISNNS